MASNPNRRKFPPIEQEDPVFKMQDRQLKADSPSQRKRNSGKKATHYLGRIPARRDDILGQSTLHLMLALERRRAERSGQSFVLMLLDASVLVADGKHDILCQLTSVVSGATRGSDLIGWYQEDEILAVIFTELGECSSSATTEILHSRIRAALREGLDPAVVSKLAITLHVFPESWDEDRPDRVADPKLYPDISGKSARNRLPIGLKRLMDITGSAILLLIHSPLLAAVAMVIKITSKGPVIFKQERLGQFGKTFTCLKFRTMYVDNDPKIHREYVRNFIAGKEQGESKNEAGPTVYKIKNDPRITPIGRFLRRTSLDEFPQFWNVLRGEMSLVGPRPPVPYEFEAYDFWHRRRILEVKPGVTGLWQVLGRSRTSFDDMVRMDLRYCQRWSLWLDLKILLATPLAVVIGNGAY